MVIPYLHVTLILRGLASPGAACFPRLPTFNLKTEKRLLGWLEL